MEANSNVILHSNVPKYSDCAHLHKFEIYEVRTIIC